MVNIKNQELELSQLDTLPPNWLLDTGDWAHMFATLVSPKITELFGQYIKATVSSSNMHENVCVGPPKTLSRSIAKSHEYKMDYLLNKGTTRWSRFGEKFRAQFKRPPTKPEDFVWNIMDFARCSIVVKSASDLLQVKRSIEERFPVVALKNGYRSDREAKGSGYRDLKLLVQVEFDKQQLASLEFAQNIVMICEVQLICDRWLGNKKSTSLSYKVLRSTNLRNLLRDFAKYLELKDRDKSVNKIDAAQVIKNG